MRYALLIYGDEAAASQRSARDEEALMAGHVAFVSELGERLAGGAPLLPTNTGRRVRVRKGKVLATDGPFAETKEQLGGIYVVTCASLEEAVALATRIPDAYFGSVEVRQIEENGRAGR
jgi:hypothetical protein